MARMLSGVLFASMFCTTLGEAASAEPVNVAGTARLASEPKLVRKINTWIDLSGVTRPTAILCPDRPLYRKAAESIADAVVTLAGKRPTVSCDPATTTPQAYNVIALGNVNNNQLIARLYFNHYAYEDSLLPGAEGHSIRTIYDPYPWHGKGHVIVIGTSQENRAAQAATDFTERIKRGATQAGVGYLLKISTTPSLTDAQLAALDKEQTPSFHVFLTSARQYLKTGREPYARHAIATLERIVKLYDTEPGHDCDWPEETNSAEILAIWDAFEECPLMSDGQRHQFTQAMLRFMRALVKHVSGYGRIGTDDLVSWNHTTFPLLGLYFGSRYFHDYYGLTEATGHLEKARACMLAQARSWKPQEDADSYLIITMRHTVEYCLAEWNIEFFESGRMRQYADYVIGICDSAGLPSGFGDSGIGRSPTLIQAAIPVAFWWYRDPGYLWVLQHVTEGKWQNPFHRDVEPKRPDAHTGVRVFPLDRQLYEYTKRGPFYNEPLTPPNVPADVAFDKVAFRESWDRGAQYMLLDGYSRGKHLHYDGGAIIELVDRGERWLLDHDYLTRNTTEHNMLSVIQDGRSTRLMPSCAAIVCQADIGGKIGFVGMEVRDYNGIDWNRNVFWKKGDAFVVMDTMTARKSGDYDLDMVWKVEDRGDEKLSDDRTFVARRSSVRLQSRHVSVITDPAASGGKAVLLGSGMSALSFVVELPEGEYAVAVRAYGVDTSSDSLFVSTGAGEEVVAGVPCLRYRPMGDDRAPGGAPRVKLTGQGRHLISVTLRERPPVRVDKLAFHGADGQCRLVVEAEQATPPRPDDVPGIAAQQFCIKWPDAVQPIVKRSHPKGIVVPVRKLCQRISQPLKTGETAEVANLLYTNATTEPTEYRIQRIGSGAILLQGKEDALCAVRGAKIEGIEVDAEMLYLSPARIAWADGQSFHAGPARVTTSGRSNLELDVATSEVSAESPDGQPVPVESDGISPALVRQLLESLATSAVTATAGEQVSPPTARPAWSTSLEAGAPVRRLKLADLDRVGTREILVAGGNGAFALGAGGDLHWSYLLQGVCYDLDAGELTPDEGPEVTVAGGDTYAHLLNHKGKLLSKHQIRGAVWNQNFGDRPWDAYTIAVRDLEQDGRNEIILGTQNYELHGYDASWNQLFKARRAVLHGSIDFHVVDADLDGKLDIFATDHYGHLQAFQHDGSKRGSFYTSIGDMQANLADLDGDGRVELVYGSSTGDLVCTKLPREGHWQRNAKMLWRFDNFGYGVNRLRSFDMDADGNAEIALASQTGYVYVLDGQGRVKWQDRAGADIVELLVLDDAPARLAYFDRRGVLTLATGDGKTRKRIALNITPIVAVQLDDRIVVGSESRVIAFRIDDLWSK